MAGGPKRDGAGSLSLALELNDGDEPVAPAAVRPHPSAAIVHIAMFDAVNHTDALTTRTVSGIMQFLAASSR